jgi:hypothetical protein
MSVIGLRVSFFKSRRMIARNFSPNIGGRLSAAAASRRRRRG